MEVKLYSSDFCPWCHRAADFLKEHKIKFKLLNVGTDAKARDEMLKKSGQAGVPVIDIDGKIIVGFDKEAIMEALGISE